MSRILSGGAAGGWLANCALDEVGHQTCDVGPASARLPRLRCLGVALLRSKSVVSPGRRKMDSPGLVIAIGLLVLCFLACVTDFFVRILWFGASISYNLMNWNESSGLSRVPQQRYHPGGAVVWSSLRVSGK